MRRIGKRIIIGMMNGDLGDLLWHMSSIIRFQNLIFFSACLPLKRWLVVGAYITFNLLLYDQFMTEKIRVSCIYRRHHTKGLWEETGSPLATIFGVGQLEARYVTRGNLGFIQRCIEGAFNCCYIVAKKQKTIHSLLLTKYYVVEWGRESLTKYRMKIKVAHNVFLYVEYLSNSIHLLCTPQKPIFHTSLLIYD